MTSEAASGSKKGSSVLAGLQRMGRSLMLPVATLPAAGLLLRFGQADMLGADGVSKHAAWMQPVADVLAAAGNALFSNLALLFAMGVAVGMARKSEGATVVSAGVGYFVFTSVTAALKVPVMGEDGPAINYGVLGGILMGVVAAKLYDKYYRIKLPPYLAFFGGRRFVPLITAVVAVLIGVVLAIIYPGFNYVLTGIADFVTNPNATALGGFVFGTANRLLIPFGLHHLLNSLPWTQFGNFEVDGQVFQGDIARFLHGDPTAGTFMTGFFPIMMFALPAAAIAFWHTAAPSKRKVVGGIMVSAALTAFLTGITEPIEFSFVYVAFPLYCVHAVLTGTSLAICNALGLRSGFSFSAGATDFILNWGISTRPWMLIIIGLVYAALYYVIFRFAITRFNLKTPGREDEAEGSGNAFSSIVDQEMDSPAPSKG